MDDLVVRHYGGIPKKKYWRPDGIIVEAIPAIRGCIDRKTGEESTRDANYDRGWLDYPPEKLKPHCDGCGEWHETLEEVEKCKAKRKLESKKYERIAEEERRGEIDKVNKRIDSIEDSLKDILTILKGRK